MILHGHTSESADRIRIEDWGLVMRLCADGVAGPFTSHVVGFRIASYVRSLQATLLSAFGSRENIGLTLERDWPEVTPYMSSDSEVAGDARYTAITASVEAMAARFMPQEDD